MIFYIQYTSNNRNEMYVHSTNQNITWKYTAEEMALGKMLDRIVW